MIKCEAFWEIVAKTGFRLNGYSSTLKIGTVTMSPKKKLMHNPLLLRLVSFRNAKVIKSSIV
jgi:hypothetical protein